MIKRNIALIWCTLVVCLIFVVIYNDQYRGFLHERNRRKLSATVDLNTGQNIATVNGTIPEVSCEVGYYRPQGSTVLYRVTGQRQDGCRPCPRGRYGDKMGLTHPTCTGPCPVGTYSDEEGLPSKHDCKKCAPGTFAIKSGLTTAACSGICPKGRYSDSFGAKTCKPCPPHYNMWQCVDI